jgi:hypothetical protein
VTYIAPKAFSQKFTCPHCGAIALQRWQARMWDLGSQSSNIHLNPVRSSRCDHCQEYALWHEDTMAFPDIGKAPSPNPDLPAPVKAIYLEAASISTKSPRGAAALLRLGIQILCAELGASGQNINKDIGELVQKGLPERVQQSLDIVRVTGNNAVHPGQIDVDNSDVVEHLFTLVNVIAEYCISMPNRIGALYSSLPQATLEQIQKRDSKTISAP